MSQPNEVEICRLTVYAHDCMPSPFVEYLKQDTSNGQKGFPRVLQNRKMAVMDAGVLLLPTAVGSSLCHVWAQPPPPPPASKRNRHWVSLDRVLSACPSTKSTRTKTGGMNTALGRIRESMKLPYISHSARRRSVSTEELA
ncbi:hypothetical protein ACO22_03171 [Paracoccidioides brasiliensis]|uniref:Uncharacterized protein n=1 Tax=Paracoccidioides brasiliensis TaxID=121759 RepID=A0A1D2JGP9_PARBR|nr:hypothetical protein ACO22_03171 [Paracoccidioides brasiliensis]